MTSKELAIKMANILDDKKALDVKVLEVLDLTSITDYFVICYATSTTHVKSLSDNLSEIIKVEQNIVPKHTEGFGGGTWILCDYGDVVVHIFIEEAYNFYDLARLWRDAKEIERLA